MVIDEVCSLYELLAQRAAEQSQALAILSPELESITYGELHTVVSSIGNTLRALGIGRNTPVAIVLPNGPEMVVALLGVASFTIAAPLNPKFLAEEFSRYISELEVGALIVGDNTDSPAVAAAQAANIPVLRLRLYGLKPGLSGWDGTDFDAPLEFNPAQPEDVALLIHTSGTTGQPKIVPLTQSNLQFVAKEWAKQMHSDPTYQILNVLPMFHVSGLLSIYWIIFSGGSMVCTPGFDPGKFFDWLDEFQPSSFGCAPSMFATILALDEERAATASYSYLRHILSGSANLPASLLARVEATFGVSLIDNYGLSEANGLTCNGAIDIPRKLGSVGKATDAVIGIMDDNGELLLPGQRGEVVARGPNVMSGYWHNPEANALAFRKGWFCTGDQGYFDEDGYLFLTGRIKELINRGGEKISPYEVDQALLAHPAVAQAATFAIPHLILGEVVAAAIVLQPDRSATEAEMRSFLVEQITYFKIPSKFIFVPNIPKGPTGKVERLKLATFFGLDTLPPPSEPDFDSQEQPLGGSVEAEIFQIWSEVLRQSNFGLDHNFFDLGGTSLEATSMVILVQQRFTRLVTVTTLVEYPTLRDFSLAVRRADPLVQGGPLQTLQDQGNRAPFFIMHGADGYGYHYHDLAKLLAPDIPVYAFTSIGRPGEELLEFKLPRLAKIYIAELRKIQPLGPYRMARHSSGGLLALEIATQLQRQGEKIEFLGMFDSQAPKLWKWYSPLERWFQRNPIPYLHWLASALQPEAYATFTGLVGDASFSEELLSRMNWLEATWYLWQYLRIKKGQTLPRVGILPGKIIRKVPVKYRTKIWNLSKLSVWHQAQEITDYLQRHPESLQQPEIKALVRAAWQGLHIQGLSFHRVRPYTGVVVIFQVEEQSMVVPEEWQRAVKGSIQVHKVRGNHGNHIRMPYAGEISNLLRNHLR